MKIYQLNIGDFIVLKTKNEIKYYVYYGCDGGYGKFVEVNKNGDGPGEPVYDQERYTYFACFASLEDLGMTRISTMTDRIQPFLPINLFTVIIDYFREIKEKGIYYAKKIKHLLSSWVKR